MPIEAITKAGSTPPVKRRHEQRQLQGERAALAAPRY
jgi:hypothetical protein